MQTVKVRIPAPEADAKRLSDVLADVFEDDGNPVTVYETSEDGRTWTAEVLLFDMSPEEAIEEVRNRVGEGRLAGSPEAEILPDINWVEKSLEGLAPVRAGRFVIHGSHDRDKVTAGAIGIEIEAALAFGTGHHGTTAGCLEEINRLVSLYEFKNMLDLGTGTGVLAIALAKLTRRQVLATDIDPVAVATTAENARLNEVGPLVKSFTAAGVDDIRFSEQGPFDLVVANILAKPLMRMAKNVSAQMTHQAVLVLSGLRIEDGPRILFAYGTQGFRLVKRGEKDGWLTLTLMR